eukprot:c1456_g1_i1.p1 GENE.c1456_g1_i1~~c1456_g1_i1.p1  ORF type:complete len:470 (-),score=145.51 c1456_g1_i1:100-1443(-)
MPPKRGTKRSREAAVAKDDSDKEPEVVDDDADTVAATTTRPILPVSAVNKNPISAKTKRAVWDSKDVTLQWKTVGTLMLGDPSKPIPPSSYIASFDLDGTLTDTASGKTFAKNREDWRLFDPCVPAKLRALHEEGYKIVIFSNQNGIAKGKTTAKDVQHKVNKLVTACSDVPIQVLMATDEDENRKPGPGMWFYFLEHCNGGVGVDLAGSFYCGDAAGRVEGWKAGAKKDFACGDRKFGHNVGLVFHTPDELFLGAAKAKFEWRSVVPSDIVNTTASSSTSGDAKYAKDTQEMIIMVGPPASGKSTFVKRCLVPHGYVRVNQDLLKTEAKCRKVAQEALDEGKSVVIDNTNSSADKRSTFIALRDDKIPVRCFVMSTPNDVCQHNNYYRQRTQAIRRVPPVAYNMFKSKYKAPTKSEGFSEIVEIPFVAKFDTDAEKAVFCEFTESA